MEDVTDREGVIGRDVLAVLIERNDQSSALRLMAHVACLIGALLVAAVSEGTPFVVPSILALAFFLATLFAPYHEFTHGTAFATPAYNRWALAIVGVLYGISWTAYRDFHFRHHAHTQDPDRDPEIMTDPENLSPWPKTPLGWLTTLSGARFLTSKVTGMVVCWFPNAKRFAGFPRRAVIEARLISAFWSAILLSALLEVPGATSLVVAFALAHVVEGLWLTTAKTGNILERTRTVRSNAFVRFFLWNMNYHCEHHGWSAVPWHALPELHRRLGDRVDWVSGYVRVYRSAFALMSF